MRAEASGKLRCSLGAPAQSASKRIWAYNPTSQLLESAGPLKWRVSQPTVGTILALLLRLTLMRFMTKLLNVQAANHRHGAAFNWQERMPGSSQSGQRLLVESSPL